MKAFRSLLVLAAAATIAACSSGPKIYVNQDPNADLGTFKTYSFARNLGTDRGDGSTSLLSQFFVNSTKQEMDLRGYEYTTGRSDLTINFYVSTKEKIRSTSTPTAGGYYGYRGGAYGVYGGYETTVQQYTEGTVTIDLIDTASNALVWEGTAVGRISSDVNEDLEGAVSEVVREIYIKYPTQQGGGPAYTPPKK